MKLSVCIITKNEEKNIERCLKCLEAYGVELVVIDTGSTDRTREKALKYTHNIYDFAWCDDFSAARNFAISKASNDAVMMIDSDEFVEEMDLDELYKLYEQNSGKVGRVYIKNIYMRKNQMRENYNWVNRIFDRRKFHYEGRIHEQVTAVDKTTYSTYCAPVRIEHIGYNFSGEKLREKANRNMRLLKEEWENLGETDDAIQQKPYILYQLGKSAYLKEEYELACGYFAEGLSYELEPKLEYVIDMVETYGYALLNSGQAETALFFENIYEEFGNCADFKFLMGLIYMNNSKFEEAVKEFLSASQYPACRNAGVNSYAAFYNIGVIYECLGKIDLAKKYYGKCNEYSPAQERMKELRAIRRN